MNVKPKSKVKTRLEAKMFGMLLVVCYIFSRLVVPVKFSTNYKKSNGEFIVWKQCCYIAGALNENSYDVNGGTIHSMSREGIFKSFRPVYSRLINCYITV